MGTAAIKACQTGSSSLEVGGMESGLLGGGVAVQRGTQLFLTSSSSRATSKDISAGGAMGGVTFLPSYRIYLKHQNSPLGDEE